MFVFLVDPKCVLLSFELYSKTPHKYSELLSFMGSVLIPQLPNHDGTVIDCISTTSFIEPVRQLNSQKRLQVSAEFQSKQTTSLLLFSATVDVATLTLSCLMILENKKNVFEPYRQRHNGQSVACQARRLGSNPAKSSTLEQ